MRPGLIPVAALAGLVLATGPAFAADVAVHVRETRPGVYTVQGAFTVPTADAHVWRVLTNYDQLGSFIPSLRSTTLKRNAHTALVQQDTTTTFLAVQKTTRVLLDIEETPYRRIAFTDVSHQDFTLYRGTWRLDPTGPHTRVSYEAIAQPRFIPPLIGPSVMTSTVTTLLQNLRTEILQRIPAAP